MTCASNDYSIGTRLNVEGLGDCTVRDRMNERYNGTGNIDWYSGKDINLAYSIGRRKLAYTVLHD